MPVDNHNRNIMCAASHWESMFLISDNSKDVCMSKAIVASATESNGVCVLYGFDLVSSLKMNNNEEDGTF